MNRDFYLQKLISHQHNQRIKVITGIRRCGKSYLLYNLFKNHLLNNGIDQLHIIEIALDDRKNKKLRDPDECLTYINSKINDNKMYYVLLDEVQLMAEFEDVLNSLLHIENVDVYVTGSNSKFLSKDVITEFRGRGDEIHINPLTFAEFYETCSHMQWNEAWELYYTYGGLPYVALLSDKEEKVRYLKNLFKETYIKDIIERYNIRNDLELENLLNIISSSIGSLTNPQKLEKTFQSNNKSSLTAATIKQYLDHFEDAFIIEKSERYDIKGKKYISTPSKYYFSDLGLRNARLNFRQQEETHIMENVIYNELRARGFDVDVGVVEINERQDAGNYVRKQIEIDFIANKGNERYYVQSAFALSSKEKELQEKRPFCSVNDSFKKIIVVKDNILLRRDDNGVITMGIRQFLLERNSLEL